jgi:hypothetical protein
MGSLFFQATQSTQSTQSIHFTSNAPNKKATPGDQKLILGKQLQGLRKSPRQEHTRRM